MKWDRVRYELRILGAWTFLLPLGVMAIYLGFSVLTHNAALRSSNSPSYANFEMSRGLLALLENGLPLAAGLLAAITTNNDVVLEVHLSLPTSYRSTILLRLAQVGGGMLLVTLAACVAVIAGGYWIVPVDQPIGQLVWLTPLLWYVGAGALLTLLLRSHVASSAVLGMMWIAQFLFKPEFLNSPTLQRLYLFATEELIPGITRANASLWYATWVENRLILIAIAVALLGATAIVLGRNELLLGAER